MTNNITGNIKHLKSVKYCKIVKHREQLPPVSEIKTIESTIPCQATINGVIYIGDELLITSYTNEVMAGVFHCFEFKSPEDWITDPRYKYYSDEYKAHLFDIWKSKNLNTITKEERK